MVFHLCAVHLAYSAAGVYVHRGVYDAVVESHEEARGLEYRAWLQQVGYGVVAPFAVFAGLRVQVHVHHGFDVARLYLHHDGYAGVCAVFLQLLYERALCQVLYAYVYRRHDVHAVHGVGIDYVHAGIEHLTAMHEAGAAFQYAVKSQLQP